MRPSRRPRPTRRVLEAALAAVCEVTAQGGPPNGSEQDAEDAHAAEALLRGMLDWFDDVERKRRNK